MLIDGHDVVPYRALTRFSFVWEIIVSLLTRTAQVESTSSRHDVARQEAPLGLLAALLLNTLDLVTKHACLCAIWQTTWQPPPINVTFSPQ
jgi:hypothetical protein